jgi:hypothetical protein
MVERRKLIRTACFLPVRIVAAGLKEGMFATIRDITESGARIAVDRPEALPDVIQLKSPLENEVRRAEIRWRKSKEIGVRFI